MAAAFFIVHVAIRGGCKGHLEEKGCMRDCTERNFARIAVFVVGFRHDLVG